MPKGALSPTAIERFQHCRRQYYEINILKLHPYEQSEEAKWGDYVHKGIEEAVLHKKPLPDNLIQYQPLVDAIHQAQADGWAILCEQTFGIKRNSEVSLNDNSIWWTPSYILGGKADLIMVKDKHARVVDWKTGNSKYPKMEQLELYCLAVLLLYPDVERVSGALIFVSDGCKLFEATYTRADVTRLFQTWQMKVGDVVAAEVTEYFPERSYSPLCGWCPCSDCPNWQLGQDYRKNRKKK